MPRSSAGEDHAGGISKEKRMRKGTKSCLPCRRRKIRCSGPGPDNATSCPECISRGDTCVAQGILADDDATTNRRLRERVAFLESRLRADGDTLPQQQPPQQKGGSPTGALRRLLSEVDQNGTANTMPKGSACHRAEEEVETSQAPLMRLMNNQGFGATPVPTSNGSSPVQQQEKALASIMRPRTDPAKDREVLRDLCSHLPSEAAMTDILDNDSGWWPLYRETLGFYWGGDLPDLRTFAVLALNEGNPPAVGLLLVCFAIGTGDLAKYLPPVERRILYDDQYAATEYGLNCLMAMGLCYMSSLQPRRAWTVYRHANTLLQLNGIHLQHRSDRHELLFWQLFHADRWVSLMIGLPYTAPDHLCQLTIAPMGVLGAGTWMYRQLGVLTGQVIDCILNVKGPTLSAALDVEEQLENLRSQLPPGYMDLAMIRAASDTTDKYTRLYRVVHYHQLKAIVHLPFLLRSATENRFEFSRKSCIEDSRRLLEAFLEIFDSDPMMVCYGTVLSFTAFTASIIVILGIFQYGQPSRPEYITNQAQLDDDWKTILRVREAIKYGATSKVAGLLCSKCYAALDQMIACAYDPINSRLKRIVLPYFGTLSLSQCTPPPPRVYQPPQPKQTEMDGLREEAVTPSQQDWAAYNQNAAFGGMSMTYDGPYLPESDATSWMLGLEQMCLPDAGLQHWDGSQQQAGNDADWNWLFADLPPNSGL